MNTMRMLVENCQRDCMTAGFRFERAFIRRFAAAFLSKKFVILTGLSGSGKTKLAQAFARWITPKYVELSDPFTPGAQIPSERVTYVVKAADRLSVEFWNSEDESNTIKVLLPRALIQEWVEYITANGLTAETGARQIREGVAATTKYSTQLNSFETIFKAAAFAKLGAAKVATSHRCYEVVAVGADWTSNEQVLGYLDGLDRTRYVTTRALDLILRAHREPQLPHFLILDEMNLSHVERYFADMLSAIESGEPLHLHSETDAEGHSAHPSGVPRELSLPPNLFIVGTVNVDETTSMFSPKVLDRANVLEFRVTEEEMVGFLANPKATKLDMLDGMGAAFAQNFVHLAQEPPTMSDGDVARLEAELRLFFGVLKKCNTEFGYRTAKEIGAFIRYHKELSDSVSDFREAFDAQIAQKLLPKLHGSRARLEPILCALAAICFEPRDWSSDPHGDSAASDSLRKLAARAIGLEDDNLDPLRTKPDGTLAFAPNEAFYPLSFEKLMRMLVLLRSNGFTSFAEA